MYVMCLLLAAFYQHRSLNGVDVEWVLKRFGRK